MVENSIIGSGYGRMRDQIMVEKHRQVVDSTLGQDQVMAELTAARTQTYWQNHLGAARPEPSRVFDILELQSHWSGEDDDGIETLDFILPEGVTNYVISVHFNESGQVDEITMES